MSGLLGTKAGIASDLNLFLQIAILIILLTGFKYGREKTQSSLKMHERLMKVNVVLQALAVLFVMGPSFVNNFSAVLSESSVIGFPLTLIHAFFGAVAEILGILFVFRKFGNIRLWMKLTFVVWLIALTLGLLFYVQYYAV